MEVFSHAHDKVFWKKNRGGLLNSKSPFVKRAPAGREGYNSPSRRCRRARNAAGGLPRRGPRSPRRSPKAAQLSGGPAALTQVLVVDAQVVVQLSADLRDQRQILELRQLLRCHQVRHDSTLRHRTAPPLPTSASGARRKWWGCRGRVASAPVGGRARGAGAALWHQLRDPWRTREAAGLSPVGALGGGRQPAPLSGESGLQLGRLSSSNVGRATLFLLRGCLHPRVAGAERGAAVRFGRGQRPGKR